MQELCIFRCLVCNTCARDGRSRCCRQKISDRRKRANKTSSSTKAKIFAGSYLFGRCQCVDSNDNPHAMIVCLCAETELENLFRRGADAANLLGTSSAAADEVEKITFSQLKLVHQIFTAKAQ